MVGIINIAQCWSGLMIKKLGDVLQPDVNQSILTLKEKINEIIDDYNRRVGTE